MKSIISTPLVLCLFICASCAMESVVNEGYRPFAGDDEGKILHEDAIDYMRSDDIVNDTVFTVNGVSFKMVYVQGGTFNMGGDRPQQVTVSDYYIAETEVTQALWKAVMGTTIQDEYEEYKKQCEGMNIHLRMHGEGDEYPM